MDQAEEPAFLQWQVQLIRDALDGYRMFTADSDSGRAPLSWNTLRERISAITGVEFGKDDLRQFVDGKKKGSSKFRVPERARLEALAGFLTDPHIAALTPDDLEDREALEARLPLYLSTYLRTAATPEPVLPPTSLIGTFEGRTEIENGTRRIRLTLGAATGSYLTVNEVDQDFSGAEGNVPNIAAAPSPEPRRTAHFTGWAVVTPEDNIVLYMKHVASRENHFWKLVVEAFFWQDAPLPSFYLQKYDWPYEIDATAMPSDEVKDAYFRQCRPRVIYFERRAEGAI